MAQVLIVEPDTSLARSYAIALGKAGHKVVVCSSAQSAIDACDKIQPDIIFLEILLAAHNGVEFLYGFRSYPDWQNIPVVVLSSIPPSEFDGQSVLWQELMISSYLYKPKTKLSRVVGSVESLVST